MVRDHACYEKDRSKENIWCKKYTSIYIESGTERSRDGVDNLASSLRSYHYEESSIPSMAMRCPQAKRPSHYEIGEQQNCYRYAAQLSKQAPVRHLNNWGTRKWLRTLLHTDTPSGVKEAVSAVASAMVKRHYTTDRNSISRFRRAHNLGCTVPL